MLLQPLHAGGWEADPPTLHYSQMEAYGTGFSNSAPCLIPSAGAPTSEAAPEHKKNTHLSPLASTACNKPGV